MSVAHAESQATIEATHPATDATLGRNGTFHVLIAYSSDEPVSLWARPYRNGEEVTEAMSNASARREGTGEALGWFALTKPGYVDEIRIRAGGGNPYREWELARGRTAPMDRSRRPGPGTAAMGDRAASGGGCAHACRC